MILLKVIIVIVFSSVYKRNDESIKAENKKADIGNARNHSLKSHIHQVMIKNQKHLNTCLSGLTCGHEILMRRISDTSERSVITILKV